MPRPVTSNRAETRWTVRIIPFFIAAAFGFATFVVVPHLCINYLYRQKHKTGTAITLIVLYFVFFILTIATYLRTFFTVQFNPGLVPLSAERQAIENERKKKRSRGRDIETQPWVPPDSNPDSPGLEAFYSKDVFQKEDRPLDGRIVAGLALSSLFALFTGAMTMTSARFIATNITNIDMLRKSQSFRLAVRVPQNSPSTQRYQTITYPLASPAWGQSGVSMNHIHGLSMGTMSPASPRDEQAKRTFAILATEPGENPWDTGVWKNCKSVMGNSILEWLLPIWHSPCCNHDSMESDYEFGPIVEELKKRYGIPDTGSPATDGIEMRSAGEPRH
ncbi:hypothetical protein G7Z17_g9950 [Cylindrodendrum hubeiense]|uniref:Uncharacterized protein n=1 Tax=Cylindrodendrum hubeiense TaxID=595255 RepID=A0A9P5H3K6_9HYPO|nr:hypothetical protein G7Z17_g9950 [Cylindrodendrum hubeiense]